MAPPTGFAHKEAHTSPCAVVMSYGATDGGDADDFFKPDDDVNIEEGGDDIGLVEKPEPSIAHAGVSNHSSTIKAPTAICTFQNMWHK